MNTDSLENRGCSICVYLYYFYCHRSFTLHNSFGGELLESFVVVQSSSFFPLQSASGGPADNFVVQAAQAMQQKQSDHRAKLGYRQCRRVLFSPVGFPLSETT
jgi:hypothetical protein